LGVGFVYIGVMAILERQRITKKDASIPIVDITLELIKFALNKPNWTHQKS
jgi:hypothetical protein